jgi:VanZ family protein
VTEESAINANKTVETANARWRNRLWGYGPLVLWLGFIFFASTGEFSASNTSRIIRPLLLWLFPGISEATLVSVHIFVRKCGHFTEYAVLGLLAARAFIPSAIKTLHKHWFLSSLMLVIVYALLDEYHQSFVATRTGSIYDSMIDAAGGFIALVVLALWRRMKSKRRSEQ